MMNTARFDIEKLNIFKRQIWLSPSAVEGRGVMTWSPKIVDACSRYVVWISKIESVVRLVKMEADLLRVRSPSSKPGIPR